MINEFLERIFPWTNTTSSRDEVKRRLQLVVAHDRLGLPPQIMEAMQKEILEVVSRYVELDTEGSEFSIENNERASALIANLRIRRLKEDIETEMNLESDKI